MCVHSVVHFRMHFVTCIFRGKQRDPNPKDNSLLRKETSTCKGFQYTFAAFLFIKEFWSGLGSLCLLLRFSHGSERAPAEGAPNHSREKEISNAAWAFSMAGFRDDKLFSELHAYAQAARKKNAIS